MYNETGERPVIWVGPSRRDVRAFPREVRRDIGQSLYAAQQGEIDLSAKPLRGFGGGSVLEIVADAIYVLHALQKKSKGGIATPKKEMDLIRQRLNEAARLHRERQN